MSMGLADINKAMGPVRASYQSRVQSQNAVTNEDGGSSSPAAARMRSTETPRQSVSNFDHRVTQ